MQLKTYEEAPNSTQKFARAVQAWVIVSGFVTLSQSTRLKVRLKKSEVPPSLKNSFKGGIINYGTVNHLMKREPFPWGMRLGEELGMIGDYCLQNHLPLLNTVVVSKETGEPSTENESLLFSDGRSSFKEEQEAVLKCDWFAIRTPTIRQIRLAYETRDR